MKRRLFSLLLALMVLFSLTACGKNPAKDDTKLQVACSLFPYYDFVRAIGGTFVQPQLLIPAGRETHSFEPTPLDVIKMSQADVLIYNGGEGELWVEEILSASGENIGQVVCMMDHAQALIEEEVVEGMEHDHTHEHAHQHGEHCDHDEITYDEHIWTSPLQAMTLCRVICEALCTADPDHSSDYRANLEGYLEQLRQLDASFQQVVQQRSRDLLVFGDRFPLVYFCQAYGLNYRAAFHGCASDTEPSLTTLKYLIDRVREEQIPVVYTIELSSRKIAEAIAETTGAKVLTFHSCQTVTRQEFDAGATYLSLMEQNVSVLKEGLC